MSFSDVFKSSFLENVGAVSILDMVLAMALAFALGLFIFYIYKKTYAGVMYSSSFGVTLVALSMITTLVILAVTSNVVVWSVLFRLCVSGQPLKNLWISHFSSGRSQSVLCWLPV